MRIIKITKENIFKETCGSTTMGSRTMGDVDLSGNLNLMYRSRLNIWTKTSLERCNQRILLIP